MDAAPAGMVMSPLMPQPLPQPLAEWAAEPASLTPLICLRDCGAPYRGRWVVYNNATTNGNHSYCAVHHLKSSSKQPPEMIERRALAGEDETSRFVRHLILHGWSIYEITDAIAASKVI